ncbi:M14 family metallopeptidase [Echinicola jeungdonensis]|uniref:M14 family metallopeptidase n=1 Tax=Echinicola jeungdonensis TaxID=709343 RepID=A0ABV5JA07_9BACT|nr:M14 family metallopeptidase [Echinicola jeungdonensis]MDN3669458.1 M14 family metallopeptidase [Echinicola jeungdonensis]
MMKKIFSLWFFLLAIQASAQVSLDYYLQDGFEYNPEIPSPESVLGFQIGEWHASPEQVYRYMKILSEKSERVKLETIGRTYESRPLFWVTITHPDNMGRLEEIKSQRSLLRDPGQSENMIIQNMPVVAYMGYSIHGDEASGVNASLLAAYHFAAAEEIEDDLKNMVILMEPTLNPDGINRFASWVNANKSKNMNGDPLNRELNEPWPKGRTNHYWFDLNRDWLPVQHPESQARIAMIQDWKPNLVLDFHEMGTNKTFFFQPGIPSRNHPLTPRKNIELTKKIAQYHVRYLDQIGSLYYSEESFDDFYYGKGSTYPDVQGAIGILFEQASARGHLQESIHGPLSFPFAIRNQFTVSLSSFEAARDMRVELNEYMRDFYIDAATDANADANKAYIFGSKDDKGRSFHLAQLIQRHKVQLFSLKEDITINNVEFKADQAFIVPLDQGQYRLVKGMFEERTEFQDSLFYDVSAWTLPMAFNLESMALNSRILNLASVEEVIRPLNLPRGRVVGSPGAYAYAFEWKEYYSPKAVYQLMEKGYQVQVSHFPFETDPETRFMRGSILVRKGQKAASDQEFFLDLQEAARETGVVIYSLKTGNTSGIDLGSPKMEVIKKPKVALLVGEGISATQAGEIWHLLDQRMEMPITLLPIDRFDKADLNRYNVIILPKGNYRELDDMKGLKSWINSGGTLIATGKSLEWLNQPRIADFKFMKEVETDSSLQKSYASFDQEKGARVTGGAIFKAKLDNTHPIGYGYSEPEIFSFRNNNLFLKPSENPFANPMVYDQNPLASGYIHDQNLEQMKNTAVVQVHTLGKGKVIGFIDNPNFRAFWFGTNKLFLNAVFFGQTIKPGTGS